MEYTKEFLWNTCLRRCFNLKNIKLITDTLNAFIKRNRTIIMILILLSILITIDIVLVNSFLELLSTLY